MEEDRANIIIKIITAIAVAALLIACLTSCKTKTVVVTEYKERKVEVRVRDTAIITAADSASVRALLHCDSAYNVVVDELTAFQGGRIKADVQVAPLINETSKTQPTKTLLITCKEDSLRTIIYMQDSIISDLSQQTKTIEVPRERSGYDRFVSGLVLGYSYTTAADSSIWGVRQDTSDKALHGDNKGVVQMVII